MATPKAHSALTLMDWKRRVFDLYRDARTNKEPSDAWMEWRLGRDDLFRNHEQSPLPKDRRKGFKGLDYFDYDPDMRVGGVMKPTEHESYSVATSGDETYNFTRIAEAHFELGEDDLSLELYWLEGYGGGLFLPFRDATSGGLTYGAGRYLYDTVKGADLGMENETLVLDFNFGYNPSCAYDPRWVCPLAPPPNRLVVPIEAGERYDLTEYN
jgi:uncharacterized protein (DUF1684 family)